MAGYRFDPYTGQAIFDDPYAMRARMMGMQPEQARFSGMQNESGILGLNRVTGEEGAKAFYVPPNKVAALFDDQRDVFYIKTADSGGFTSYKAYEFVPRKEEPQKEEGISREDIEEMIREEIEKYGKQFIRKQSGAKPDIHVETQDQ